MPHSPGRRTYPQGSPPVPPRGASATGVAPALGEPNWGARNVPRSFDERITPSADWCVWEFITDASPGWSRVSWGLNQHQAEAAAEQSEYRATAMPDQPNVGASL